ncbi:Endophilin-A [Operophtera brumata]|uniref:Endophilin-A n=1 Tax=Operophtera brumata TaxID=104452 RepID=A0A0L7L0M3_OPEBR|nr:Endophilin-A [Operophtera brumata]
MRARQKKRKTFRLYVTEKMGGAEGTKLDLDFVEMERKTDVTCELVEELQTKTKEFLQPNPTARAKMAAVKGISKLSGQAKSNTYPQPEGVLADCMLFYGKKLGEDSMFSQCMIEFGEALKQMADVKYSLDDNIKQSFLEPLHHLQTKDLKEVMVLSFDSTTERNSRGVGSTSIANGGDKQKGLLEYHQQCTEILQGLVSTLMEKKEEAVNRPKLEFVPKTLADLHIEGIHELNHGRRYGSTQSLSLPPRHHLPPSSSVGDLSTVDPLKAWDSPAKPMALRPGYNKGGSHAGTPEHKPPSHLELFPGSGSENDVITLINKVDENWFEGSVHGKTGYFPISYVQESMAV